MNYEGTPGHIRADEAHVEYMIPFIEMYSQFKKMLDRLACRVSHGNALFSKEFFALLLVVVLFGTAYSLSATTTNRNKPIIYQGRLMENGSTPVPDGNYSMKFSIYDAASGGTCLWATGTNEASGSANCAGPAAVTVAVARGMFRVELGDDAGTITNMAPMNLDFDASARYLGVTVGGDAEMTPRVRIGSYDYAYNSDELDGIDSGSFLRSDAADTGSGQITFTGVSPSAYWSLDETSGSRADSRGSNTLTDNNTVTNAAGKVSNAGQFTAANSEYLSSSDTADLSTGDIDFSISTWVYMDTKPSAAHIIEKHSGSSGEYMLRYTGGGTDRFVFNVYNSSGTSVGSVTASTFGSPSTATWYFLTAYHDASRDEIGVSVNGGAFDISSTTGSISDTTAQFTIGADRSSTPANFWNGRIDETALWKRKLSSDEISYLYNGGSGRAFIAGNLLLNPASASANYTLLGIAVNGTQKAKIDAEGDLTTAGNLTVSGTSDNSMTGNMIWSVDNTYDIGASGANRPRRGYFATEVVVGGTVTISTNSIVGSGATTLSSTSGNLTLSTVTSGDIVLTPTGSGKVGVGTASPAAKLQVTAGAGIDVLKLVADATDALFVSSAGYTGVGTASPATRLDVAGLTVNTDADGTVGAIRNTATFTKNDSNTRTFSVAKIVPTFNFGGSNTNTTVNVLDIDSTNTAVTGLTTNLLKASYGGTQKFLLDSSGNLTIAGGISSIGGSILPSADDTYDLGSSSFRWRDLFLGPSSLRLSTTTGETGTARAWKVGVDETNGATDGNFRIMEGSSQYLTIGTSGNVGIGTGATDPASLLHVAGIAQLGTASTTTGQLKLFNSGSANATTFQSGAAGSELTFTWPTADGTSGYALSTNGSGVLSWVSAGGGTGGWVDDGTTVRLETATDFVGIGTASPTAKLSIEGGGISIGGAPQRGKWNTRVPYGNTITAVDSTGDVGGWNSTAIGADGLPVIAYWDYGNTNMKVLKCNDIACTGGNETITTVDSVVNGSGHWLSLAIGADTFPVISYYDAPNADLKVAKCNDTACTGNDETITTVDSTGSVGNYSYITIGTDGFPIIAYRDDTNADLRVTKCGNAACSSGNTQTSPDTTGSVGYHPSIAIATDGFPVIAHLDSTNMDLKVTKCGNAACSSGNTNTTVDSTGSLGSYSYIAIGSDGLPVVAYWGNDTNDLKILHCGNSACTSSNNIATPDSGNAGQYISLAIGADGFPIIAHQDDTANDVRIAKCGDLLCSPGNATLVTIDSTGVVGREISMTVGADGLPIIAYYDVTNADLKVAHCGADNCIPYWTRR